MTSAERYVAVSRLTRRLRRRANGLRSRLHGKNSGQRKWYHLTERARGRLAVLEEVVTELEAVL